MHVIQARNVNDAYIHGMQYLTGMGMRNPSRAGEVLVANTPVTTIYNRPTERVLFDPRRDANPFFHLMESVWMLAGMRDARWLDHYVKDFSSRFAEENGDAHGAYGHRWRKHWYRGGDNEGSIDQLLEVGLILLNDPTSRQAVISMWDPLVDLGAKKRDIPCNDMIMFRSRFDHLEKVWYLDTTVLCRSNDAVWGAYGANAVHMSIMAEVVAGLAGMKVGRYYQVSNNFHVYTSVLEKVWPPVDIMDPYTYGMVKPRSLIDISEYAYRDRDGRHRASEAMAALLLDCEKFVKNRDSRDPVSFGSAWINEVVIPMQRLHEAWREDKNKALSMLSGGDWTDWKHAASQWMTRRMNKSLNRVGEVRVA